MNDEQNPYSPAIAESESSAEEIHRSSTWAAALGAASLLFTSLFAPFALYHGHRCLRRIRQRGVGLEHRGAALTGAALGWIACAYFVFSIVLELRAFGQ